jgi:hypothetical protein
MDKMKSCPFCNYDNMTPSDITEVMFPDDDEPSLAVRCENCGACGAWFPANDVNSEFKAIEAWNERTEATS